MTAELETKDGDEDDQMDVSCLPERKTLRRRQETVHNTPHTCGVRH